MAHLDRKSPLTAQPGSARIVAWLVAAVLALASLVGGHRSALAAEWENSAGTPIYGIATSADGSIVVTGRRDNTIAAYDADGALLWEFPTEGIVYDVTMSADGSRIAAASEDRHVYMLDRDGNEVWRYRSSNTFLSVAITSDGGITIAGGEDQNVYALDRAGALLWQSARTAPINVVAVYGSERGFRAVVGTRDSRVAVLGPDGQQLWQVTLGYPIQALAALPNGAQIVAGDRNGGISLLDGATGATIWTYQAPSRIADLWIARDGTRITAGTRDGDPTLVVLDGEGSVVQEAATTGDVFALSIAPDAQMAALAIGDTATFLERGDDGTISVPEPESRLGYYLTIAGIALAVIALLLVLLGLRRRPNGERAWRGAVRRQRTLAQQIWAAKLSYLFLLPTLALLLIFNYYPAFSGIYHSFTDWNPAGETKWVGLDQFRALADNQYFRVGIGNMVLLVITAMLKLIVPLIVAEMIFHLRSGTLRYVMRTAFVLQVIVPGVVGILIWVNIYDPTIGLANQFLGAVGLEHWQRSWLGDPDTAMWSIIFIGFPWVSVFALLIFYGGLISIPGEIFDAAEVDGAGPIRRFFNIDLPLLLGQVRLLVILTFIGVVQEFGLVFLTTGGGPGSATYVPSLEMYYQAVRFNNFGLASAIGAVLFLVILIGTIINLRYVRSSVEYST